MRDCAPKRYSRPMAKPNGQGPWFVRFVLHGGNEGTVRYGRFGKVRATGDLIRTDKGKVLCSHRPLQAVNLTGLDACTRQFTSIVRFLRPSQPDCAFQVAKATSTCTCMSASHQVVPDQTSAPQSLSLVAHFISVTPVARRVPVPSPTCQPGSVGLTNASDSPPIHET